MTTIPDAPGTPDPSTTPDDTSIHEENARVIRLDLQRLAAGIRGFALLTSERRRKLTTTGHVEDDFLRRMALLIDAHGTDVATPAKITGAEIRDHLRFSGPYQGVGEELMLHGRKMSDTLLAERADIGQRALVALKIARDINSPADRASLVPHLEAIDREFSRGRRRRPTVKKTDEIAAAKKKEEEKP